ncbi:MAG TPA: RDD family protein, partial [Elusimicrobiota bacterium]|nr:RDD family protein [Elusimicrobiota bacterium]
MDNEPLSPVPAAPAADTQLDPTGEYSAGFWLRAGAYMIDGLIVAVVSVIFNLILPAAVSVVARLLLSAGYFTVMPVRCNGQTVGKMAAGVAIVRDDGTPLTYGRALARWFGYLVSGITLCLGFICAAFTHRKRALHDYIADTRVVRVEELGLGRKIAVIGAGLLFPLLVVLGIVAALMIPKFSNLGTKAAEGGTKG